MPLILLCCIYLPACLCQIIFQGQDPGFHVNDPVFVSVNQTWRVTVDTYHSSGLYILPLLRNRSLDMPAHTSCEYSNDICCLTKLSPWLMNSALDRFVEEALSPCSGLKQSVATDSIFAQGNYDFVTGACTHGVCFGYLETGFYIDIPESVLLQPWFSKSLGTFTGVTASVSDLETSIWVIFLRPVPAPWLDLHVLEQQFRIFDSVKESKGPLFETHFISQCEGIYKPHNSLWLISNPLTNLTCQWFCKQGYTRCPRFIDQNVSCVPLPVQGSFASAKTNITVFANFSDFSYTQYHNLTTFLAQQLRYDPCMVLLTPRAEEREVIRISRSYNITVNYTGAVLNGSSPGLNESSRRRLLQEEIVTEISDEAQELYLLDSVFWSSDFITDIEIQKGRIEVSLNNRTTENFIAELIDRNVSLFSLVTGGYVFHFPFPPPPPPPFPAVDAVICGIWALFLLAFFLYGFVWCLEAVPEETVSDIPAYGHYYQKMK